jgi:hypothetical protein
MHPDSNSSDATTDHGESQEIERRAAPATFGQRHGLKVMAVVMSIMFATVIVAQVAC